MPAVELYKANLDVILGATAPTSSTAIYDPAGVATILYGIFDDVKNETTKSDPSGNSMTKNSYIIFTVSTAPDFDIYEKKILRVNAVDYTIKYVENDHTGSQRLWLE